MAKKAKYDTTLTAAQALTRVQDAFKGKGRKLASESLDNTVDVVVSKGTDEQCVEALQAIPADEAHAGARMLILRRLWQLGDQFIDGVYYREAFSRLKLLKGEYQRMVKQFGELAVIDFLRPPALRARPAVGNAVAQL